MSPKIQKNGSGFWNIMKTRYVSKVKIPDKTDMDKVDLIIHISASLLKEYKATVSALEDCLMDTTSAQLQI